MGKKYEKPLQRNLKDFIVANGSCGSGHIPLNQCYPYGNANTSKCSDGGGVVGIPTCNPTGAGAITCSFGDIASV